MDKQLLFMVKDEDIIIKGIFKKDENKVYFKKMNDEEKYFDIDNIENIQEGLLNIYEEDEQIMECLINKIISDDTILDKIKANEGTKLLFQYEA